jgi:Fe2+ or Zn2+ uptake regulation protein
MKNTTNHYISAFRAAGRKITPQRRLIFQRLAEEADHPTAENVYQRVAHDMPDISRSTVYNTLKALVELGALDEVEDISSEGTRYDTETGGHHHLYCLRCGKLIDIHQEFAGLDLPQEKQQGYRIVKRQVTFYGYCPECADGGDGHRTD